MSKAWMLAMPVLLGAADVRIDPARLTMFQPLPAEMADASHALTEAKIRLGRMLYYEPRLSKNHDVSCNSCHPLDDYGADRQPVSDGHRKQLGTRNSPTVYNAAGHIAQFWDGRAPTVEEQAKGPVLNPVEMALPSEAAAVAVLKSMPEYVAAFRRAFPRQKDPVTYDNMAGAIGAFERKLVTPSRWDKFLRGDQVALSGAEKAGFNRFFDAGCVQCHQGAYLGGNSFQKLGLVKPWTHTQDLGRFTVSKQEAHKLVFKVPSLRNIDQTAPYYHDGSVKTLEEAVRLMAEHQTGRPLSKPAILSIITWLKALTGPVPAEYIKPPVLPKSTATTPKSDPS